jgi:hypothetical protein
MFNMSRWLMLEMNRDEINKLFQDGMSGKLEQNHELLIHLGGGVYVTVGEKFPTVDITDMFAPMLFLSGIYIVEMLLNRLIVQPPNK